MKNNKKAIIISLAIVISFAILTGALCLASTSSADTKYLNSNNNITKVSTETFQINLYYNTWGTEVNQYIYYNISYDGNVYRLTDYAKDDLDDMYGSGNWRFKDASDNVIGYTFSGSPGGKSWITLTLRPSKLVVDHQLIPPTTSTVSFSNFYMFDADIFIGLYKNFNLEKRNNYIIVPEVFEIIDNNSNILDTFNYLGYRVFDYSKNSDISIGFKSDNSSSKKILILNVNESNKYYIDSDNLFIQASYNSNDGYYYLGTELDYKKYIEYKFFNNDMQEISIEKYMPSSSETATLRTQTLPWYVEIYTYNTYNISYDLAGGTFYITEPPREFNNHDYTEIPQPSRQGYIFVEWQYSCDGGSNFNKVEFNNPFYFGKNSEGYGMEFTSDVILKAIWEPVEATIEYHLDGGTIENIEDCDSYINGTDMELPIPTKRGYTFEGWFSDENLTNKIDKLTAGVYYGNPIMLYAKWSEIRYNIEYKQNGGSFYITQPPKTYGVDGVEIPTTSRQGYIFEGWYLDEALTDFLEDSRIPADFVISGDITLWAKWRPVEATIEYNLDGGTIENIEDCDSYINGTDMELPIPTKRGYTFEGWFSDENLTNKIDKLTAGVYYGNPIMLYAKWSEIRYNIEYKQNGGSFYITEPPKTYGVDGVEIPTTSRQGYIFEGWYLDEGLTDLLEDSIIPADFVISGDITLWAKWRPVTATIEYYLDGGAIDNIDDYDSYLNGTDMTLPIPTKEGYDFIGWYSDAEFVNAVDKLTAGVYYGNPIMLYAKFEIKKYTIRFYIQGEYQYVEKIYNHGDKFEDIGFESVVINDTGFFKITIKQYICLGWSTDYINQEGWDALSESSTFNKYNGDVVTSDLILYAYCYLYSSEEKITISGKTVDYFFSKSIDKESIKSDYSGNTNFDLFIIDGNIKDTLDQQRENYEDNIFDKALDFFTGKTINWNAIWATLQKILIGVAIAIVVIIIGRIAIKLIFKV